MFDYFWDNSETIADGMGFLQFVTIHLLWLVTIITLCIVVCSFFGKMKENVQRKFLISIAVFLVSIERPKLIVLYTVNRFDLPLVFKATRKGMQSYL